MPKTKTEDMIGEVNGHLTIIEYLGLNERKQRLWKCQCDCGNTTIKTTNYLHNHKKVASCGCSKSRFPNNQRHGMCYTRINSIYRKMKQRCLSEYDTRYKDYGGRGITICPEWIGKNGFMNFYEWAMSHGYSDELTIDRIDVNGNYCPENCKWSTWHEQSLNTRRNVFLTFGGETKTLREWSQIKKIPYERLRQRIVKLGWSAERALTT